MRLAYAPLVLLVVVACGAPSAKTATPLATPKPVPTIAAPASRPTLFIEYATIHERWVEKFVPTAAADVQAWKEAPTESFQHILIKGSEAPSKKKAQALFDRVKKGEDFAKLARENTEDAGSRDSGGEYPASRVEHFVDPVRDAWTKLKPAEVALVESKHGFHVVKKSRPSEEILARAYKTAKAPALAKKLALDLAGRLKGPVTLRAAIADSVESVLGEAATNDEKRPKPVVVDRERLEGSRLPAAAKAALVRFADGAHSGDVLDEPAVDGSAQDGHTLFVARAVGEAG